MNGMHLQLKSFIDTHSDVESIQITYSDASYFVLTIRCLDKNSRLVTGNSKAFNYDDLPYFSENGNERFMHLLQLMYDECQCLE